MIHSTSKYESNKVVLASTIIEGSRYWDSSYNAYIVFPNPRYTDNLSIRITMTTPARCLVMEEKVTDVDIADDLDVEGFILDDIPETPEEIITKSIEKELKPRLRLDFTANSPLLEGVDLSYSGGGDRLLLKNGTYVKQAVDKLIPTVVELADDVTNKVDPRFVSMRYGVPTGWFINADRNANYTGTTTSKYTFANEWICKFYNYDGYIEITTPIYSIGDNSKGMLFGGYITLTSDITNDIDPENDDETIDTVDEFSVSLIFYDNSNNILTIISKAIEPSVLNTDSPESAFITVYGNQIPTTATKVAGRIRFGELFDGNNVTLTLELPQLINNSMVTYPVLGHRKADVLAVSNRNIKTKEGVVACEFNATHNKKNYYFDSRRVLKDGFAAYFNGGKLGFIINDGSQDYEIQYKWRQEWYDSVLDKDIIELPTDPEIGDRYLIFINNPSLGSNINKIAEYTASGWEYTDPIKGSAVWVEDESSAYVFTGTRWSHLEAEEEGRSSAAFSWDSVNSIRKIYGNGILLLTDTSTFNIPVKTNRIIIGCDSYGLFHINTKIIKFIINDNTNPKIE